MLFTNIVVNTPITTFFQQRYTRSSLDQKKTTKLGDSNECIMPTSFMSTFELN